MRVQNIFAAIPDELEHESFAQLLDGGRLKIERIISKGHSSPESGWYDQEQNEWVMLLRGEAVLSFEDQSQVRLREGDYLNIPAHKKHKVDWTDPHVATVWLAVHY